MDDKTEKETRKTIAKTLEEEKGKLLGNRRIKKMEVDVFRIITTFEKKLIRKLKSVAEVVEKVAEVKQPVVAAVPAVKKREVKAIVAVPGATQINGKKTDSDVDAIAIY